MLVKVEFTIVRLSTDVEAAGCAVSSGNQITNFIRWVIIVTISCFMCRGAEVAEGIGAILPFLSAAHKFRKLVG